MTDTSRTERSQFAESRYAQSEFTPDKKLNEAYRPGGFMEAAPNRDRREPFWTPTFIVVVICALLAVGGILLAGRFL